MKKGLVTWSLCLALLAVMLPMPVALAEARAAVSDPVQSADSEHLAQALDCEGYEAFPLVFVPNGGQTDERVSFTVSGTDKTIFFTEEGLTLDLCGQSNGVAQGRWTLKLSFIGADRVTPESLEASETVVSYFVGEPDEWYTNLRASSKIVYRDLWPGRDLVFSGARDRLKYEFVIRPGADPAQIKLAYNGADSVEADESGGLLVSTPDCDLTDDRPQAFQDGGLGPVAAAYRLEAGGETGVYSYGFALGPYDAEKTLVIDPAVLVYSGLIGGTSRDEASGIAVDTSGTAYVVGCVDNQTDFPVTVGPSLSVAGNGDVFVAKLNADGTGLEYCGFIGGSKPDAAKCVAVDAAGCALIGGNTYSADFPAANAGWTGSGTLKGLSDSFVAKVSADGTHLLYCGYLGGASNEAINGIFLDDQGSVFVTGSTASGDFPATAGWPNATSLRGLSDAFVAKIASDGSALLWSGFLGGNGRDYGMGLSADATGVYITGQTRSTDYPVVNCTWNGATALKGTRDAFVTKLAVDGSAISYSGYFGGSLVDDAYAIAVDASGCAYLAGETDSADLPVSASWTGATVLSGSKDAFVAKVNAAGTDLVYSGYLGGTDLDTGCGIAADASGAAYVAGDTRSADFPVTNAFWQDSTTLCGNRDAFITKINPAGTALEYSGFLGGNDFDYANCIAIDGSGAAYVGGYATSTDFPHVSAAWPGAGTNQGESDAFAAKIAQMSAPDYVCEIVGGSQYETLDAAIADVPPNTPTTIRLLQTIERTSTLAIDGAKRMILDLNGDNLNINVASGAALEISQGSSLTTTGSGALNATGYVYGIYAWEGATVDITGNVGATHCAVYADTSGSVQITGDISGTNAGIEAHRNADVDVTGSVQATASDSTGVSAAEGATVSVSGSVTGGRLGVTADYSGVIEAESDVTAATAGGSAIAAYAQRSGRISIGGDAVSAGQWGVMAENSGRISVDGDVQGHHYGILVSTGAEVFVAGDVRGVTSDGAGVNAYSVGKATIDGAIQAYKAMIFGESDGGPVTPTTKWGYLTYSDGGDYPSFIWVRDPNAATTFILSNEEGGLIDQLIADGHGPGSLYDALANLQVTSGDVISDEFLEALARNPGDSPIFTTLLSTYAGLNSGVAINMNGTVFTTTSIKGRDYHGDTGYSTYPPDISGAGREIFTYADSADYYIDAPNGGTTYKVFAIAWSASSIIEVRVLKPAAGVVWTGEQTIEWEAADPDDDASKLKISLEYALAADGSAWQSIAANQANTGKYVWDTSQVTQGGRYRVRVTAADPDGGTATATSEEFVIVVLTRAIVAAPNPARDSVMFYYDIPADGTLHVYDIAGRLVYSAALPASMHAYEWNLHAGGRPLANGVYLYIVVGDAQKSEVGRLVVSR